jgi:hypothetical protein
MRKCKNGWHLDDGMGWNGFCSDCVLKNSHPTLRRMKRRINELLQDTRLEHRGGLLSDLPQRTRQVPLRHRARLTADYRQAASLLKEDLVWSGDFDNIRYDLMLLITQHADEESFPENLSKIVQKLISEENDLSI